MMKKLFIAAVIFFAATTVKAQSKDETAVANAVEQLRKAMVDGDSAMLQKLASPDLSYGHSSGHVDTQKEFVQKIASGKSDFVSINLTAQTIFISKKVAVVRHKLDAVTNDNNKPGEVHLLVMLIWQKQHGHWKLLARQAVKTT